MHQDARSGRMPRLILILFALLLVVGLLPAMPGQARAEDAGTDMDAVNARAIQTLAAGGKKVVQVALGWSHSAAVFQDGSLWTWGHKPLWRPGQRGYQLLRIRI